MLKKVSIPRRSILYEIVNNVNIMIIKTVRAFLVIKLSDTILSAKKSKNKKKVHFSTRFADDKKINNGTLRYFRF